MLTKRNPAPPPPRPAGWTDHDETVLAGHRKVLTAGVELTIKIPRKRAQRCRFMRYTERGDGITWLTVFDGKAVRSFHPSAVAVVHTTRRMGER